jgi:hypothetical protein
VANFPALKTGAFAQYPSDRARRFSTSVYRFVDGKEQRFPGSSAPLRQWTIRLDLLDEAELVTLEQFFVDQGGRAGTFAFTDPWDGTGVFEYIETGRTAAAVTIRENRN